MKDIEQMFYESEKRLDWFINGIHRHCLSAKVFSKISTERLCEIYNVELEYFGIKKKIGVLNSVHTRQRFATEQAEIWLKKLNAVAKGNGNILSSKAASKLRQCWRIYHHYGTIYCSYLNIPYYNLLNY